MQGRRLACQFSAPFTQGLAMRRGSANVADVTREIAAIKANLSDILDRVSRVTSSAGGGIASEVANAQARLSDTATGVMNSSRDWLDTAESGLTSGVKQARGAVERNPLAGLAIAAGIGFLVGLSSRSR
jgi:ElaB/YqjD/DUF883 family membrane-anchored ribosome-binding protein